MNYMDINNEISAYLVRLNVIDVDTSSDAIAVCDRSGERIDRYIIRAGLANEYDVCSAVAKYVGMTVTDIAIVEPCADVAALFSASLLKKYCVLPLKLEDDGSLTVAVGDPLSYMSANAVSHIYAGKKNLVAALPSKIRKYLDTVQAEENVADSIERLRDTSSVSTEDQATDDGEIDGAASVQVVESIIEKAVRSGASDIHIEPFEKLVKIRYRVDGVLRTGEEFDKGLYSSVCARMKIISGMNIAERRVAQDGRIERSVGGVQYDFRISSIPTVYGEKFVVRVLDKASFGRPISELGFLPREMDAVRSMLSAPYGIVLLSGPTGCGKTTTLYSFLRELNSSAVNITTIEDPVEYTMDGINQMQVNAKAGVTFSSSLPHILRQDPDIIMIGEIRDEETAHMAIRSATTGHLVFSTIHTNDAPGAVNRLVNMGVSKYLVADALVSVIAQRLVRTLCPVCKEEYTVDDASSKRLGIAQGTRIYRPSGCPYCSGTGYRGRVAVHETMTVTKELSSAISTGASAEELRKVAVAGGMLSLRDSCREYVLMGVTSVDEYNKICVD